MAGLAGWRAGGLAGQGCAGGHPAPGRRQWKARSALEHSLRRVECAAPILASVHLKQPAGHNSALKPPVFPAGL